MLLMPTAFLKSLNRADRVSLAGMATTIAVLHVVGFALLLFVVPKHFTLSDQTQFTIGLGLLAYFLGARHAFDADHIAAIDTTTRKLIADNHTKPEPRQPLSVGFWFALGHSTIVVALVFLLAAGVNALVGPVADESSTLQTVTGTIGPLVSGTFLWVLGLLNLMVLVGIVGIFRRMRHGHVDEAELEEQLNKRGILNRILSKFTRVIRKPTDIYPVGVLFGLGFDTATEIALLALAGGAAVAYLPFYAMMILPILFTAGMVLMDTLDGVLMNRAYGWALGQPVRRAFYNLTVTLISVLVALVIGTVQLATVAVQRSGVTSGPLVAIADLPMDHVGYAIVALFALTWVVAWAVWRFGNIEEKWSASPTE